MATTSKTFSSAKFSRLAHGAQIELIDDEVVDVTPDGRGALLNLKSGTTVQADRVVLATGNLAPHALIPPGPLQDHPAYRANPWCALDENLPDHHEDVLLVGTGLTMIDLFLTMNAIGWVGRILAVSRTGLLPLPHFKGSEYNEFPPENVESLGLHQLVALMEDHCGRLRAKGMNPALVVNKLRPFTQRIWRNLSVEEKREFSRDYRTRWNVIRHRIPPAVAGLIEAAQRDLKLQILKGKLRDIRGNGARLTVTIDQGDAQPAKELAVGLLVNCTGPRESLNDAPDDLYRRLFERGLVRPDELDIGIEVTPDFAVVDDQEQPSQFLFAIGSLLKGTLWETTAVPELRAQAHQVAKALVADESRHEPDWAQETPANLVEYYI